MAKRKTQQPHVQAEGVQANDASPKAVIFEFPQAAILDYTSEREKPRRQHGSTAEYPQGRETMRFVG